MHNLANRSLADLSRHTARIFAAVEVADLNSRFKMIRDSSVFFESAQNLIYLKRRSVCYAGQFDPYLEIVIK
jgi:hypothetical protein